MSDEHGWATDLRRESEAQEPPPIDVPAESMILSKEFLEGIQAQLLSRPPPRITPEVFSGHGTDDVREVLKGMVVVQVGMGIVAKRADAHGRFMFADYAGCWAAAVPPSAKIGLLHSYFESLVEGVQYQSLRIYNAESGQWIQWSSPIEIQAIPNAGILQAKGGAKSYLRRYLLLDAWGMAVEDEPDTDRQATAPQDRPRSTQARKDGQGDPYIDKQTRAKIHTRAANRAKKILGNDSTAAERKELGALIATSVLVKLGFVDGLGMPQTGLVTQGHLAVVFKAIDEFELGQVRSEDDEPGKGFDGPEEAPPVPGENPDNQ